MSLSVEQQLEEARRALPTPEGSTTQASRFLVRTVGLWILLIALFVFFFHVFNQAQEREDTGERAPPAGSGR